MLKCPNNQPRITSSGFFIVPLHRKISLTNTLLLSILLPLKAKCIWWTMASNLSTLQTSWWKLLHIWMRPHTVRQKQQETVHFGLNNKTKFICLFCWVFSRTNTVKVIWQLFQFSLVKEDFKKNSKQKL